jgi:hypothetical protein
VASRFVMWVLGPDRGGSCGERQQPAFVSPRHDGVLGRMSRPSCEHSVVLNNEHVEDVVVSAVHSSELLLPSLPLVLAANYLSAASKNKKCGNFHDIPDSR